MEWLKHLVVKRDGECILVNGWKVGTRYGKYSNGQLRYARSYDHDQQHGIQRRWCENGQLWYEHNYDHDQQHGIQRRWYENGQLKYKLSYDHGQQHGIQRRWYENGQLAHEWNQQAIY